MKNITLTLLLALVFVSSCKKDSNPPVTDVYVAGYQNIGGKKVATLWKNGEAKQLSTGQVNEYA